MQGYAPELLERIAEGLEASTGRKAMGGKAAAIRRARKDWPDLPLPVFEELAEHGLVLMGQGAYQGSLTEFVEQALLSDLVLHVELVQGRKSLTVRPKTSAGRRALTELYERGVAIAVDFRRALVQLWKAWPAMTEVEMLEGFGLGPDGEPMTLS